MLKTGVIEFPAGRCILVEPKYAHGENADSLPDLPVLPETLLAMELQLQQSSTDLRAFSETVLSDLGATIQILRMAGREYGTAGDRPVRMEDCICDLGPAACFDAAVRGAMAGRTVAEIWRHAREAAYNARHLAETILWAIRPDHAYMAGMLHVIGLLPSALGWDWNEDAGGHAHTALKLAERWAFPGYLRDFFCEMLMPGYNPQWSALMAEVHRLAGSYADHCPLLDVSAALPYRIVH